ncbi:MAG: MBL fold metallo-hydrolase [Planctomycetota bacterium]
MSEGSPSSHALQIGRFRIRPVNDGIFRLDGGSMFGVVPKSQWMRQVEVDQDNRIPLALRCFLIEDGERKILLEGGMGEVLGDATRHFALERKGGLVARLEELGLAPGDIDLVVLTHLHWDHMGALVEPSGPGFRPIFEEAELVAPEKAWAEALAPSRRAAPSYVTAAVQSLRGMSDIRLLPDDSEILPGLSFVWTGGHTEHHVVVRIEDGDDVGVFWADLIPTAAHVPPRWVMAYDVDPIRSVDAKETLVAESARDGWTALLYHDPDHAFGRIEHDGRRYRFVPLSEEAS